MSELLETTVADIIERLQKIEKLIKAEEQEKIIMAQTVEGLDRVSAYAVTTLNSLINLLVKNNIITEDKLSEYIKLEQKRLHDLMVKKSPEDVVKEPKEGLDDNITDGLEV